MKSFIIFAFIALAFGQSDQYGPIVPTQVTAGTAATGTLLPTTEAAAYHVNSYAVWIPATAYSVNVTAYATDSNCDYLNLFISAVVAPCSYDDYEDVYTACDAEDQTNYDDFSTEGIVFNLDARSGYNFFRPGQWLYYSVGREYSGDNTETCGYSVTTSIFNCANGSLPGTNDEDDDTCYPFTMVSANTSFAANVASPTGNEGSPLVYATMIGMNNAYVHVQVNSSSDYLSLYGQEAGVDASYDYICTGESSTEVGNFYMMDLYCYSVRPGWFVLDMINDEENFTSTVNIMPVYCPSNMGGFNCSFPVTPFNAYNVSTFNVYIPGYGNNDGDYYNYAYFYIDFPANSTLSTQFTIMMTQNIAGSSSYFYPYFNGYPNYEEDRFDYYESLPTNYEITAFDFVAGQRLYLALDCESQTDCNVTVSFNTSGVMTTGMNMQMTTGPAAATTAKMATTGPAAVTTMQRVTTSKITSGMAGMTTAAAVSSSSVVIPSIFAIFALFALLF
jgi:hypothetical protein